MAHTGPRFRGFVVWTCAAAALLLTTPVIGDEDRSSSMPDIPSTPSDFRFAPPRVTVGMRGNWIFASAGSDIYDFVTDTLTIDDSSFNTPAIGGEVGLHLGARFDLTFGFEYSNQSMDSEYRDKVEQLANGTLAPILQTTSLRHSNAYVGTKFALLPRGRRISRFAWIPNSFVPYVGAGVGMSRYKFEQDGDFVDFVDDHIFSDYFRSEGWTPSFHVLGGADVRIHRSLFLSLEGRYMWADAELDSDFVDFDPMDLGGFRLGAGLNFVF